jgi:hypothetical protein
MDGWYAPMHKTRLICGAPRCGIVAEGLMQARGTGAGQHLLIVVIRGRPQGRQVQVLNGHGVDSRIQFKVPRCVRLSISRPVDRIFNLRRAVHALHPFLSDLT